MRFLLLPLLIALLSAGMSIKPEPAPKSISVFSDAYGSEIQVRVENFWINGIQQNSIVRETPFTFEVDPTATEVTLRQLSEGGSIVASTLRLRDGEWIDDGLKGVGSVMHFSISEDQVSVRVDD